MRVSHAEWASGIFGILASGSFAVIFAQDRPPEFGRPAPPNAVPKEAPNIQVAETSARSEAVRKLAFSPDGRVLASASVDQTIGLWDVKTGERLTQLTADSTYDLRFSPDGWMLGAAGDKGSYRLWEVSSGGLLVENRDVLNISDGTPSRFSPELDRLAVGSNAGQMHLIETATGKSLPAIQIFDRVGSRAVAFSPDGNLLAVGSGSARDSNLPPNQVILWDLTKNKKAGVLSPILEDGPAGADSFRRLEFSSDGSALLGAHSRRGLFLWDVGHGFHWPSILMSSNNPFALSGDGKTMVRLKPASRSTVEWVEMATAEAYWTLELEKPIAALAISLDGTILAAGSAESRDVLIRQLTLKESAQSPRADDLKQAVEQLSDKVALQGRKGMAILIAGGNSSVAVLETYLKLAEIEAGRDDEIKRLIRDLDHDDFFKREAASKELRALGQSAVSELQAELERDPPLEVTTRIEALLKQSRNSGRFISGETLRRIRAIEVLEKIGTSPAQRLLEELAKGPESAQETHEAALALKRLQRMKANR